MEAGTNPVSTDHFAAEAPPIPLLFWVFSPERQLVDEEPFRLAAGDTLLGREGGPGIRLVIASDSGISRQHAVLHHDERTGSVTLRDTSSRQSTWVNGGRLTPGEALPLAHGDILRLGDSVLVLSYGAAAGCAEQPVLGLLGRSPLIAELRAKLPSLAAATLPVLLLGEPGTGKERVAQALHALSQRPHLVPVDCGALAASMVESTLFGHIKGAFTGATTNRKGVFETAHGGTLFLDEVGNLSEELQAKLLRVLSERQVHPIGAEEQRGRPVDVFLIAATNSLLQADARAGHFRLDLFRRLAGVVLTLPPLRARREDVLYLLAHLPAAPDGKSPKLPALHTSQVELLLLYDWPGNVGELLHVRGHLMMLGFDASLRARLSERQGPGIGSLAANSLPRAESNVPLESRAAKEPRPDRSRMRELLVKYDGKLLLIEKETGWSRKTLRMLVEGYGLEALRK